MFLIDLENCCLFAVLHVFAFAMELVQTFSHLAINCMLLRKYLTGRLWDEPEETMKLRERSRFEWLERGPRIEDAQRLHRSPKPLSVNPSKFSV